MPPVILDSGDSIYSMSPPTVSAPSPPALPPAPTSGNGNSGDSDEDGESVPTFAPTMTTVPSGTPTMTTVPSGAPTTTAFPTQAPTVTQVPSDISTAVTTDGNIDNGVEPLPIEDPEFQPPVLPSTANARNNVSVGATVAVSYTHLTLPTKA